MYLLLTWQVAWRTPQVPSTQWSWSAWCAVWPGAWSCCPTPWRSGWSTGGLSATNSCLWVLSRPTEAWCWMRPGSLSEALLQHWHHATRKSDVCCSVSDREWVTLIFCTVRTGHDLYCYVAAVDVIQWVPVTWGHCSWQQEQVVWGCCHIYLPWCNCPVWLGVKHKVTLVLPPPPPQSPFPHYTHTPSPHSPFFLNPSFLSCSSRQHQWQQQSSFLLSQNSRQEVGIV